MAVMAQSSRRVSRNGFMIAVMGGIGTIIGLFYVGTLLRYLYPKSSGTPPLEVKLHPDGVIDPASGQVIPFVNGVTKEAFYYPTVPDKSVVVGVFVEQKVPNGQLTTANLRVVEQTCTHLGCPVAWVPGDNKFECPCHGSQFHRDTTVAHGPANNPLHEHNFTLNGDTLTILDRKN
jgi:Rieske Fe-S protein